MTEPPHAPDRVVRHDGAATGVAFVRPGRDNVNGLMALRVRDDERHLIAPNPEWIAQAAHVSEAITFGVFAEKRPVGLISLIDPRLVGDDEARAEFRPDCLWVWRLMVDRERRGRGFGAAAIGHALRYATLSGLDAVSLTTMDAEPGNALGFYERLGFRPTGRRVDGEIELMLATSGGGLAGEAPGRDPRDATGP